MSFISLKESGKKGELQDRIPKYYRDSRISGYRGLRRTNLLLKTYRKKSLEEREEKKFGADQERERAQPALTVSCPPMLLRRRRTFRPPTILPPLVVATTTAGSKPGPRSAGGVVAEEEDEADVGRVATASRFPRTRFGGCGSLLGLLGGCCDDVVTLPFAEVVRPLRSE